MNSFPIPPFIHYPPSIPTNHTTAEKAKHKKLLATLTPLVKEVKAVLANPSEEQKAVVAEKIAEAAKANQEVYENLRGKLKKSRVEEMNKVMEPQIFSNQYMFVDLYVDRGGRKGGKGDVLTLKSFDSHNFSFSQASRSPTNFGSSSGVEKRVCCI